MNQTFKQFMRDSIHVVSCRLYTGAFISKEESEMIAEKYKALLPEVYQFKININDLGEFLTEEEIKTFYDKNDKYIKMMSNEKKQL